MSSPLRSEAVVARLDELLEAERAGARVTLETAAHTRDAGQRDAIEAIHRDEVKWCAMLAHAIRTLDGMPSSHTGAFYAKAMAIDDLLERLAFVNRDQAWVVSKLREVLPLVNDAAIRRSLTEMLVAHELNYNKVDALLNSTE
jgi:nitronate monooxygenase